MARAPYTFIQRRASRQDFFHALNLGQRLTALADGRGVQLEVLAGAGDLARVRITAVPAMGPVEILGEVVRAGTPELRARLALAIALAQDERAHTARHTAPRAA